MISPGHIPAFVRFVDTRLQKSGEQFWIEARANSLFRGKYFSADRTDLVSVVSFQIEGATPCIIGPVSFVELMRGEYVLDTVAPGKWMRLTLTALKRIDGYAEPLIIRLDGVAIGGCVQPQDVTA